MLEKVLLLEMTFSFLIASVSAGPVSPPPPPPRAPPPPLCPGTDVFLRAAFFEATVLDLLSPGTMLDGAAVSEATVLGSLSPGTQRAVLELLSPGNVSKILKPVLEEILEEKFGGGVENGGTISITNVTSDFVDYTTLSDPNNTKRQCMSSRCQFIQNFEVAIIEKLGGGRASFYESTFYESGGGNVRLRSAFYATVLKSTSPGTTDATVLESLLQGDEGSDAPAASNRILGPFLSSMIATKPKNVTITHYSDDKVRFTCPPDPPDGGTYGHLQRHLCPGDKNKPNDPGYCQDKLPTVLDRINKCKNFGFPEPGGFIDLCPLSCGYCQLSWTEISPGRKTGC